MLQLIRERLTGGFAVAILAIIFVPFAFFGIGNYSFLGGGYAAKVNGIDISPQQLENAFQQQLLQYSEYGELPPEFMRQLRARTLDNLIRSTLVDMYLTEEGFRVSNDMITELIQREPEFQVDGAFSKERYYAWLEERSVEPMRYEENLRQGMRESQLQRSIGATAFVTPAEYRRYLNLYGEQRQVAIATFELAAAAANIDVSDEDVQTYYDERPDDFQSPESVDFEYLEISRDALADEVEISEEQLEQYYAESSDRYLQDEQRQARHILITFGDDESAAEEQARAIAARASAGEPFDDLARTYSEDGGTSGQGGDLGLVLQSQMPGALGDAIFDMQQGEIRGPVKSDFGFHIVRLDEIVQGGPLPLEQVRGELERELGSQLADDSYRELERALSDALFDAADISAMAAAVGYEVRTATGYTRFGGEPFGTNQAMIDAVFDPRVLDDREISDLIEIDANRTAVVQVTDYHEAARKPLDEVRSQIVASLRATRARELIRAQVDELQDSLRAGADFETAAAEIGATVTPFAVVARQDSQVDRRVLDAIFRAKKPPAEGVSIGTEFTQTGDQAVFIVTDVLPGRPESIPLADRDARKQQLSAQSGVADFTAFVLELERNADIVRSEDALAAADGF